MSDKNAFDVLNQIDSFDGHGDTNSLNFFLKSCDAMMKIVKETEKNKLAELIFAMKLKGKAQEVTQYHEFENWETIKDFLLEHFTDKRPPSHFLNLLMNIKQNYRESIKEYGERIQALFNKYKETCNLNHNLNEAKVLINSLQSVLVSNFRKGLHDEKVQMRIIAENTVDLDRAISVAIELELEQNDKYKTSQNFRNINVTQNRPSRNQNVMTPQSQSSCMFCHKNNHFTSQCRQLYRFENNQNNSNFNSNNNHQNFYSQQRKFSNSGIHNNRRDYFRENNSYTPNNNMSRSIPNNNSNYPRNYNNQQNYNNRSSNNHNDHRHRFSNQQNFSFENANYQKYPMQQRTFNEQNHSHQYHPNQQNSSESFIPQVQTIQAQMSTQNNPVNSTTLTSAPRENFSGNEL